MRFMPRPVLLMLTSLLPFLSFSAYGANNCDPDLFKGVVSEQVTDNQRLFFLSIIDEQMYKEVKSGSDARLNILVEGVPIGATNKFEEFNSMRTREFRLRNFQFGRTYARNYLASDLSESGLTAYIACLKGSKGIQAWIEPGTAKLDEAKIHVHWSVPNYGGKQKLLVHYSGVAEGEKDIETRILTNGGEIVLSVKRDKNKDFSATFNVDNSYADLVVIPKPPRTKKEQYTEEITLNGVLENTSAAVIKYGTSCILVPKFPAGWKFVANSWRIHPPKVGPPRYWGASDPTTSDTTVCYTFWISRYHREGTTVDWRLWATAIVELERFEDEGNSFRASEDAFDLTNGSQSFYLQ